MSKAFTLIETLVVVGITGLLIVSAGGGLTGFLKAKRGAEVSKTVQAAAAAVTERLKMNLLEVAGSINCGTGVGETALTFETGNGGQTRLICDYSGNKIASESAHGNYNLLNEGVIIVNCAEFINCTTLPSTEISLVKFKFSLGVSGGDLGSNSWTFESKVAIRK